MEYRIETSTGARIGILEIYPEIDNVITKKLFKDMFQREGFWLVSTSTAGDAVAAVEAEARASAAKRVPF